MHRSVSRREAPRSRASRCSTPVGIPDAGRAARQLPARALGRHAAARDDRDGAVLRPAPADRRRADHRARRDDPGADPRAAAGACAASFGIGDHPDHARPRRRRRAVRRGGRDVRRPDRRAGRWRASSRARSTRTRGACSARLPRTQSGRGKLSAIPGTPPRLLSPPPAAASTRAARTSWTAAATSRRRASRRARTARTSSPAISTRPRRDARGADLVAAGTAARGGADVSDVILSCPTSRSTSRLRRGIIFRREVGTREGRRRRRRSRSRPARRSASSASRAAASRRSAAAIVRLIEPTGGLDRVRRHGHHAPRRQRRCAPVRRDLQIVFQDPTASLNPRMTRRRRSSPSRWRSTASAAGAERRARVAELLERVGLRRPSTATATRTSSPAASGSASASPARSRSSRS